MSETVADRQSAPEDGVQRPSLCFIVDPDYGFMQGFSSSLHAIGIDTVELRTSTRLAEAVDDQCPDIVFFDCNPASPYECVRALFSLRECRFAGRVQLLGRCDTALLENFERIGRNLSLAMLPALQKPIDFSTIGRIVLGQKLNCRPVAARDLSLKTAIARDFITFWYQPKIDLRKRQIVGAEAFARVSHPKHGILSPALFLAGAAEEDLIDLAERAIVSALELSARLGKLGIRLQIAVNVSVHTLMKLSIVELVAKNRPTNEELPGLLLDVAETHVLNKVTLLRDKFLDLGKHGIALAIDNVGRGNSSFEVFRHLPFAELKIDPSFVQGCATSEDNANVCKSLIQIAHNFGRNATAVGIETAADSQQLMRLGCDIGQGYLFGRPMTERHLITMLMAGRAESEFFCSSNIWDVSPRPIERQ